MKKLLLTVFVLFITTNIDIFPQERKDFFSVAIDSIKVNMNSELQPLICYTTIKNLSSETLEFYEPIPLKSYQEDRGWNLIIKKDGSILSKWDDGRIQFFRILNKKFTIEKNEKRRIEVVLLLSTVIDFESQNSLFGYYTAQLELSNIHNNKAEYTVMSNIVEFQIE